MTSASNIVFDQIIEQIQPDLERLSPDLGKLTELKVINRARPQNPLVILADENGDEWVFRMRWNFEHAKLAWLRILLVEILVTEIGTDLDLRVARYHPYRYGVTSPLDGSYQVRWGNITRYLTTYTPFRYTTQDLQVQCVEQYLVDVIRILIFSLWVGDTDETYGNWLRHEESNEPLRIDFANSICFVRHIPNAMYMYRLIAREGLCEKYSEVITRSYESMVGRIHDVPLHRYLEKPIFSALSDRRVSGHDCLLRLTQSCEVLTSRETFETFINWMRKDAWGSAVVWPNR